MIHVVTVPDEDFDAALQAFSSPEALQGVLENVMAGARAEWIRLAGERLSSSRRDYVQGIQQVVVQGSTASIALVGRLPNMIEQGHGPFDMHDTLLGPDVPVVPFGSGMKGKHARAEGGFWRVVPFRHQTPGSIGQGGGTPMGNPYQGHSAVSDAAKLGKAVHRAAKKLAATKGGPGEKTQWGGRLPEGLAPKLKPHHTTDIYAGMVRVEKTYEKATQSTYMTFRAISDGAPEKWMHPGIKAANLSDDVQKYVDAVASQAIAALVGGGG